MVILLLLLLPLGLLKSLIFFSSKSCFSLAPDVVVFENGWLQRHVGPVYEELR